ncbi:stage II sporulation protein M [Candidatus Woesearchaeota archaeon]|nr:stage II sporulation protein M [Candidatus Woesearchaeota archaeon]
MVIESLLFPLKAEKKPWEMFFIGFLYTSVAIFLSLWIFEKQASFIMVFLTVMAAVPIVYGTMQLEESKDIEINKEKLLLKEHNKAIVFLMFLFLGITLSSVLWYVVLPSETVGYLFQKQTQTITDINNQISGNVVQNFNLFTKILFNNLKVLAFCILFAFIYGAGAIFILTWNATVIGTAIGNFIRSNIGAYVSSVGFANAAAYFQVVSLGLLRYAIHGIPEIVAYFYGGLAGGIISVAVIKHHYASKKFSNILLDSSELLIIAVGFLLVAAFIEVYITPLLF